MKRLVYTASIALLLILGCGKKEKETQTVPPGFCRTAEECQPIADREQAYQNRLRDEMRAQGVHEQYLPCGTHKPTKQPNGFWNVPRDSTGCPPTASQQDPHPEPRKPKP